MVLIFDSDENSARRIKKILVEACSIKPSDITLFKGTPKELVIAVKKDVHRQIKIVFLDITMQTDMNGIDIANQIVSVDKNIHIVFVTSYGKFYIQQAFLDYYDLNPVAYLIKPVNSYFLRRVMKKIEHIEKSRSTIWIKIQQSVVGIRASDVVYIGIDGHATVIHTEKQTFKTYVSIEDILKTLPEGFVRCHKSYIINSEYIQSHFENNSIRLMTGTVIPVSRSYQKQVRGWMNSIVAKNGKMQISE